MSERQTRWAAEQAGIAIGTGDGQLAVATKFAPVPWRPGAESVVEACRQSAERLGVSQIPLYQIHVCMHCMYQIHAFGHRACSMHTRGHCRKLCDQALRLAPTQFPDIIQPFKPLGLSRRKDEDYWEGLARCYEEGLAANVGVCNYGPEMVSRVHDFLASRGIPLASNQINLSLMYRTSSAATVVRCAELGVPIIACALPPGDAPPHGAPPHGALPWCSSVALNHDARAWRSCVALSRSAPS